MNITKYNNLKIVDEHNLEVGDMFFAFYEEYVITVTKIEDGIVSTEQIDPKTGESIRSWGYQNINDFIKEYKNNYISDFETLEETAKKYMFDGLEFTTEGNTVQDNLPVTRNNKKTLALLHTELEAKARSLNALRNMSHYLIHQKQQYLEAIKRKMDNQLSLYRQDMKKIEKVIGMIELYLGVKEEIVQIHEGTPATIETPLSLRQLVLYADEELGNCEDGGIDFTQLDLFDTWMAEHYSLLLPEAKGIVAMKPRRDNKDYGDRITNVLRNRWNHETYFLIRNGENVYRICAQHINVGNTMFPKREEYKKIFENGSDKEKDNFYSAYTTMALLVQGLIDRTDIFKPIHEGIKVSNIEEKYLDLIYDAEAALPTGRLLFKDWMREINKTAARGSRIYLIPDYENGNNYYRTAGFTREGFFRYYDNKSSCPPPPETGLYKIENMKTAENENVLGILYMPLDSWNYFYIERKNRVGWVVDLKYSWFLNYDRISLNDINYYINSRVDRPNYLKALPLLRQIRKKLIEEMDKENNFKKMLQGMANKQNLPISEKLICEAIDWWKFKNIWKRPITEDDVKAVRMIKKKLHIKDIHTVNVYR